MPTFEISTTIHAPVTTVVAALMKADNHPYWTKHLERFEVVSGEVGKAGAVGACTIWRMADVTSWKIA